MFKTNRKGGTDELSDKPPLEMIARFLAAQAWSKESLRPSVPQGDAGKDDALKNDPQRRARYALEVSNYMNRHWRDYIGPAQLLVRTCLKRPNRHLLSRMCAVTGAPENVVLAVWDAGVEHTASDLSIPDPGEEERGG